MSNSIQYTGKDQNWAAGETTYWFVISGKDYGTQQDFDEDQYGIIENGSDDPVLVDSDGEPLVDGDNLTVAVNNMIGNSVTHAMRAE